MEILDDTPAPDIKRYHKKVFAVKPDVWNIALTQEVQSLELKVEYLDENSQTRSYEVTFTGFADINSYVKLPIEDTMQSDVVTIQSVTMYIWYMYKGDKNLETHKFTEYNKNYKPEALTNIYGTISDWVYNHPEVLL